MLCTCPALTCRPWISFMLPSRNPVQLGSIPTVFLNWQASTLLIGPQLVLFCFWGFFANHIPFYIENFGYLLCTIKFTHFNYVLTRRDRKWASAVFFCCYVINLSCDFMMQRKITMVLRPHSRFNTTVFKGWVAQSQFTEIILTEEREVGRVGG